MIWGLVVGNEDLKAWKTIIIIRVMINYHHIHHVSLLIIIKPVDDTVNGPQQDRATLIVEDDHNRGLQ